MLLSVPQFNGDKMNIKIHILLFCVISFSLIEGSPSYGEARQEHWDFGIGGGINFDGNPVSQILLIPAYNRRLANSRHVLYRLEGNIELLEGFRKITLVAGLSPFLRWYMKETGPGPFVEIGAGVNVITRNHTGNKEHGGFIEFSPSAGAGVRFGSQERPISISLRLRHLSNAHIFPINQSVNTLYLILSIGM
jgi:hypothetical protein